MKLISALLLYAGWRGEAPVAWKEDKGKDESEGNGRPNHGTRYREGACPSWTDRDYGRQAAEAGDCRTQ